MTRPPRVLNRRLDGVPEGAAYVGRPTRWGNPYAIGPDGNRAEVLELYKAWLRANVELQREARLQLAGRDLVCWCAPKPCHADVLLRVANGGEP